MTDEEKQASLEAVCREQFNKLKRRYGLEPDAVVPPVHPYRDAVKFLLTTYEDKVQEALSRKADASDSNTSTA
jgi:hypothetical protein